MPRKTIEPEETAMLVLTKQEWELTRTELKLSPAMKKRFEAALVAEGEFNVLLTSKQIEKLLDAIIYKLDYDESVIDKRIWLDIFDKAHFLLEGDMDEDNAPEDSSHPIMQGALTLDDILMSLPEEVRKEFALEVKQNPPNSIDELQDFM